MYLSLFEYLSTKITKSTSTICMCSIVLHMLTLKLFVSFVCYREESMGQYVSFVCYREEWTGLYVSFVCYREEWTSLNVSFVCYREEWTG